MRLVCLALLALGCTRTNPDALGVGFPDLGVAQPRPDESCGAAVACGARGSHVICTRGVGSQCQARFLVSDGASFPCASCGDCTAAQTNLALWCAPSVPMTTTGGSPTTTTGGTTGGSTTGGTGECASTSIDLCRACCKTQHYSGYQRIQAAGNGCVCKASVCGYECKDHCLNNAPGDDVCQQCVDTYFGLYCGADVEAQCLMDPECAAYTVCWKGCG